MFEDYITQLCRWQVEVISTFNIWEERLKDRVMRRRGKKYNYILDKLEETRGYWNLK